MAGKVTLLQRTYQLEDSEITRYTGVTYGTIEGSVKIPTVANVKFVGVVDNDQRIIAALGAGGDQTGRDVAVQISGYGMITASGAITYGDELILAVGGVTNSYK